MIVVMDNGYATYAEQTPESPSRDPSTHYLSSANEAFGSVVINELIPMIDSTYRTISDREHRAMAGLSMGAMQTMAVALNHLETFSYIGGFSLPFFGAPPRPSGAAPAGRPVPPPFDPKQAYGGVFAGAAAFNQRVHLLWFGAGTAELVLNATLRENVHKLTVQGIKSVLYQAGGSAHEWQTWRHCLNEFAPLLFQA